MESTKGRRKAALRHPSIPGYDTQGAGERGGEQCGMAE